MLHIIGRSHAPVIFRAAAQLKGITVTDDINSATLVLIAIDTLTAKDGKRFTDPIKAAVENALTATEGPEHGVKVPVILTSQVEPGFCRQFDCDRLYHQAETLRIKDAIQRALNPEQIILGLLRPYDAHIHPPVTEYFAHWDCPLIKCSYEEAEFSKIAINVTLAHQVQLANALEYKAKQYGCDYKVIRRILQNDSRIGKLAYTEPGNWTQSPHLLRDYVTFNETGTGNSAPPEG